MNDLRNLRNLWILLFLLAGCCPSSHPITPSPTHPTTLLPLGLPDGPYRLHRVVDGDTIILSELGRLRLSDFDAPALGTPAGGAAAAALSARYPPGSIVNVKFVRRKAASTAGPAGSVIHDRYGRLLGSISSP